MHFLNALLVASIISLSVLVHASPKEVNFHRRTNDYEKDKDASLSIILVESTPTLSTTSFGLEIPAKDLPTSVPSKDLPSKDLPSKDLPISVPSKAQPSPSATSMFVVDKDKDKPLSTVIPGQGSSTSVPGYASTTVKTNLDDKPPGSTAIPFIPDKDKLSTSSETTSSSQGPDKDDKTTTTTLLSDNFYKDKLSTSSETTSSSQGPDKDDKTTTTTLLSDNFYKDKLSTSSGTTSSSQGPDKDDKTTTTTLLSENFNKDKLSTSSGTTFSAQEPDKDNKTTSTTLLYDNFYKDKVLASSTSPMALTHTADHKIPSSTSIFSIPPKDSLHSAVEPNNDDKTTSMAKPLVTAIPLKDKPIFPLSDDKNDKISTESQLSSSLAKLSSGDTLSSTIILVELSEESTPSPSNTLTPASLDEDKIFSTSAYAIDNKTSVLSLLSTTAYSTLRKDKTDSASASGKDKIVNIYSTMLNYLLPEKDRATSTSQNVNSLGRTKDQTIGSTGSVLSTPVQARIQITSTSISAKDQSTRYLLQPKPVHTSAQDQSTTLFTPANNQTSKLSVALPTVSSDSIHAASPSSPAKGLVNSAVPSVGSARHVYSSVLTTSSASPSAKYASKSIGTAIPMLSSLASNNASTAHSNSLKDTLSSFSKDKHLISVQKSDFSANPSTSDSEGLKQSSKPISASSYSPSPLQVSASQTQPGTSSGLISLSSEATPNSMSRSVITFGPSTHLAITDDKSTNTISKPESSSPTSVLGAETSTYPDKGLGPTNKAPFSNGTSTVIPVWSPSMLGNAYGGGFVTTPSVFMTIFSDSTVSTTSAKAIPTKHESSSKPENHQPPSHSFMNVAIQSKDTSSIIPDTSNADVPAKEKTEIFSNPASVSTSFPHNESKGQTGIASQVPSEIFQSSSMGPKDESKQSASLSVAVIPTTMSAPSSGSTNIEQENSSSLPLPSPGASRDQSLTYGKPPEMSVTIQSSQSPGLPSAFSQPEQVSLSSLENSPQFFPTPQPPQTSAPFSEASHVEQHIPNTLATPATTLLKDKTDVPINSHEALVSYQSPLSSALLSAISSAFSRIEQAIPGIFTTVLPTDKSQALVTSSQVLATTPPSESSAFSSASVQAKQGGPPSSSIPVSILSTDQSRVGDSSPLASTSLLVPSDVTQAKFTSTGLSPSVPSKDESLLSIKGPQSPAVITIDRSKETSIPRLSSTSAVGGSTLSNLRSKDTAGEKTEAGKPRMSLGPSIPGSSSTSAVGKSTFSNLRSKDTAGQTIEAGKLKMSLGPSIPGFSSTLAAGESSLSNLPSKSAAGQTIEAGKPKTSLGPSIPGLSSTSAAGESTLSNLRSKGATGQTIESGKPRTYLRPSIPGVAGSHPTSLYTSRNGSIGFHYSPGSASAYQGFGFKLTTTNFTTLGFIAISVFFFLF